MMSLTTNWQPSAPMKNLLQRAEIITKIRLFFAERGVIEVETPALSQAAVTDIHLASFSTRFSRPNVAEAINLWLITSPEFFMKRLLAAGSGPIFQLCRCFRNEEAGRLHNPEFTMLEWYRPGYDMFQLINEVDDLLQSILDYDHAELVSYQQAFIQHLQIDPLCASQEELQSAANALDSGGLAYQEPDRDTLLQLLFMLGVEPNIGLLKPTVVYHFPASQAALAEISCEDHRVAQRFEVYFKGIELANGFRELTDSNEQRRRFEQENCCRQARGLPLSPIDKHLLNALASGMPASSGVALGVDRLIMLALNATSLDDVIAFPLDRC